jgi:hypothetical protein
VRKRAAKEELLRRGASFAGGSRYDLCGLYVQLLRYPSLDGIILLSKVRERDIALRN